MTGQKESPIRQLRERLAAVSDLRSAAGVLAWDQQTYMPEGGVEARSEHLATLSRLAHETFVAGETYNLIEAATKNGAEPGSDDEAIVRLAKRDYERSTRIPSRLVAELTRTAAIAEHAWVKSRAGSDFTTFAPHLERLAALQREAADHLGYEDHPYDALLDGYERGVKKADIESMFEELKAGTVPLIEAIAGASGDPEARRAPLRGEFGEAAQEKFGRSVITAFGYDWKRGRIDRTVHPFCINFGPGDVRITTRYDPTSLSPALFGTMHECGHALYEQGVDPAHSRTPLAGGVSLGVHESQSRLWENLVGRSREFWSHYYPKLKGTFPGRFDRVDPENFYRAMNTVQPSEIRVEADEITYNLHILLRFELEVALLEGSLEVSDLPEAWNEKMEQYLGVTPRDDAHGVLQDVHWSHGLFGYFPTYTIGNVLSVQIFESAVEAHPEIPEEISHGKFSTLLGWLRENIHRLGSKHDPKDLIKIATSRQMEAAPYLGYLKSKFGELYELS